MNLSLRMRRNGRGFAMLTALALVALVAAAMAAAASIFRLDLRRTADALDDAQLRQLLAAGEREAHHRLPSVSGPVQAANEAVALPSPLAAEAASLKLSIRPGPQDGTAAATVEASLAVRALAQTLRYERGPNGWRLASTELLHDPAPPRRAGR